MPPPTGFQDAAQATPAATPPPPAALAPQPRLKPGDVLFRNATEGKRVA